MEDDIKYYKLALAREKAARKAAEKILEDKALELYQANNELITSNANLEETLEIRTAQIKETEKMYRHLVESANDIIFQTDINGHFTFVNHTGELITGLTVSEIIGTHYTAFVDEAFHEGMAKLYHNQVKNNIESAYFEYKLKTKTEEEIWLGQNTQLIHENNKPIGFLAVSRNITERVKSDNELRRSEEKYKKMFEGAFDGMMRVDVNGNFVEWNSKMIKMLGYTNEELSAMSVQQIIHPDDAEKSKAYFEKLIISKNNRIINVEVNSTATYENGEISGSIDNVRDVSERVTIEDAIIYSEEKYRSILENLELGLLEVDVEENITKVYPSFCAMTGYKKEDLIGKNHSQFLLHPDSPEKMEAQEINRGESEASVYEVQIKKKDGSYTWVIMSGAPFKNRNGKIIGAIAIHLDISSRKRIEQDLKQANRLAEESSKAKELFLANMSHEIRTPLNAVIGLSGLLRDTDLNDVQTAFASNIYNAGQGLLLLVNDILDLSKIASGKLELNMESFDLRQTMSTIISSSAYLAEEKGLQISLNIQDDLSDYYKGDELKLTQILTNLVNNAVKFTAKGLVEIRIEKIADENEQHTLKFQVIDTGKGIAPDALLSIFEDFNQEDNTISKVFGGTGLGLSICKKLVAFLGGDIYVESTLGAGSIFTVILGFEPIQQYDLIEESVDFEDELNWENVKILTVEDNHLNQFVLKETLKRWNASTDIAENGEEAIEILLEKNYDIILMDMQMPIMDGFAATNIIRRELKSTVPIIAFTANALSNEKERCLAIGMNDYISKPFKEQELKEKISRQLKLNVKSEKYILSKEVGKENTDSTIFTVNRLFEMSRGNSEFVNKLLDIFIVDGELSIAKMRTEQDADLLGKLAHKIKPSIDYLSNVHMKDLVRKIEQMDFVQSPELLDAFLEGLGDIIAAAKNHLKQS